MTYQTIPGIVFDVAPQTAPPSSPIAGAIYLDYVQAQQGDVEVENFTLIDSQLDIQPSLTAQVMVRKIRNASGNTVPGSANPWYVIGSDLPTITTVTTPTPSKYVNTFSVFCPVQNPPIEQGSTYLLKVSYFHQSNGMNVAGTLTRTVAFR